MAFKINTKKSGKISEQGKRYLALLAILVLVCFLFSMITSTFFSLPTIKNVASQVSVQSLVAIGMTVLILTGGIDLSVGTGLMLCGVISAMALNATGSVAAGFAASIATGAAVGLINGVMVAFSDIPPFMATLAMQCVCRGVGWTISGAERIMVNDYDAYNWLGQANVSIGPLTVPVSFFLMLLAYAGAAAMLKRTTFGRRIYAVGGNRTAARESGIDVRRTLLLGYLFSGLCVGVAAIVSVGRTVSSQPQAGTGMEFDAITAAVIGGIALTGGMGSLWGTFLGVVMVGVISFGLGQLDISPYTQYIVKGLMILISVAADADGWLAGRIRERMTSRAEKGAAVNTDEEIPASKFDRGAEHRVLAMEHISKSFAGVRVLKDVSLRLERGKVHALMGENGAGKSTLMKILTGSYTKDAGVIRIDGEPYAIRSVQDAQHVGISIIYQELSQVSELTVAQNIYLGRELATKNHLAVDRKQMAACAAECLDRLGLQIDVNRKIRELTVGQQQMVEIVKAYISNAWIIVMDEPTSAITDKDKDKLFELIAELKRQNVAIVYISHRMNEIFEIADELTVLRDGEHIKSTSLAGVTEKDIINWMVGRDLGDIFRRESHSAGEVVLEVRNLTKKGVFENVSFTVHAGEVVGFSGLIGAGRTEVMRCIFGLDDYDSGEIRFKGRSVKYRRPLDAIRDGIALVPEDRRRESIIPRMSVLDNMALASLPWLGRRGWLNAGQTTKGYAPYVERFSIKMASLLQHIVYLSGGNQQKAVLAKWLSRDPQLLILDEPTRGIDIGAKADIYELIDQLARQGRAVIMVSSEMGEIFGVSDRIVVMHEGRQTGFLDNDAQLTQEIVMTYATGNAAS